MELVLAREARRIDRLRSDLRIALRSLARSPALAVTTTATHAFSRLLIRASEISAKASTRISASCAGPGIGSPPKDGAV